MLTLLHISDLHFGPPYLEKVGEALLRQAPELHPDVIVASGDFTQRAKPSQFDAARDFMAALPDVPQVTVPGNHDVPLYRIHERLFSPHALYQQYINERLHHVTQVEGAIIVGLDSTAPLRAITNGRIRREQLDYCYEYLQAAPPEAVKIVVAHHHFAPAPDYERDEVMPKARRAMDVFLELGVEMILGGHLHRAYVGNSLDVYPRSQGGDGIVIVQSGTSTSRRGRAREREKNSFNLIQVNGDMLQVTHYMYFDDLGRFGPLSRHVFPRKGKRFVEGAFEGSA